MASKAGIKNGFLSAVFLCCGTIPAMAQNVLEHPPSLSFKGLGASNTVDASTLTFKGLGAKNSINVGMLAFTGWGARKAVDAGTLSFKGLGASKTIDAGMLAFTGWGANTPIKVGLLSFKGCGIKEEKPEPRKTPQEVQAHFQGKSPDPHFFLEGNWIIEWENAIREGAFATLAKGGSWKCGNDEDCRYHFERDKKAPWGVSLSIPGMSTSTGGNVTFSGNGKINTHYNYGVLGDWGSQSTGMASKNRIVGRWTYDDNNDGKETWKRVRSQIKSVKTKNDKDAPYGTPIDLVIEYSPANSGMRGNRPARKISISGEGLWGLHRWWIPRESDIEVTSMTYQCKNGDNFVWYNGYASCLEEGGVKSLEFTLTFWPGALPGLHYLYVDNHVIPFNLDVSGYPATTKCNIKS